MLLETEFANEENSFFFICFSVRKQIQSTGCWWVNVCVGGTELVSLLCLQINGTNLPAGGDQEGCLLPAADITI